MSRFNPDKWSFPVSVIVVASCIGFIFVTIAYAAMTSTTYMPSDDETCMNAGYTKAIIVPDQYANLGNGFQHQGRYYTIVNNTVYIHCTKVMFDGQQFSNQDGYTPYKTYNKTSDIERILTKGFGHR